MSKAPPPAEEAPRPEVLARVDVGQTLLTLVSERTGYPPEMLKLDADLEAELSIDSIKRIEILGALTQRLGLPRTTSANGEGVVLEKLAAVKTLRGIADYIEQRMKNASAAPANGAAPALEAPKNGKAPAALPAPAQAVLEFGRIEWREAPTGARTHLSGQRWWLVPDPSAPAVGEKLAALLVPLGVTVLSQGNEPAGPLHGFVDLRGLSAGRDHLWSLFASARKAIGLGAGRLLAASGLGGRGGRDVRLPPGGELRGAGVAALLKSLAREKPELRVCAVDLDASQPPDELANALFAEVGHPDHATEAAWAGGVRRASHFSTGAAPHLGARLDADSVVLVTGGARGIAAHLAAAVAKRFHCKLELAGRRVLNGAEAPELASCADLPALRKALIAQGGRSIGEIEAAAQAAWGAREARSTLAAVTQAGGKAVYHAVDTRSPSDVERLLKDIHARHGRLDAVFHAAGITEDKGFADKERESFERVVETKLGGALSLVHHLPKDVKLLAFFGSVSGVFGNRGQADYAAANDALDRLAWALQGRFAGPVVSLDFGPWAGAGMVTPELAREYERRGIPLIPLEAGVASVMEMLFSGANGNGAAAAALAQVVVWAGGLEAFAGAPPAEKSSRPDARAS